VCYTNNMEDEDPDKNNLPALLVDNIPAPTSAEILDMLRAEVRFSGSPELRAVVIRYLKAGYTVKAAARKLDISESVIWQWRSDDQLKAAVEEGTEYRRKVLGQRFQDVASSALDALEEILSDPDVSPRDRVKAAEGVLDRCGISPANQATDANASLGPVIIDVDFDERLARIVANGQKTG